MKYSYRVAVTHEVWVLADDTFSTAEVEQCVHEMFTPSGSAYGAPVGRLVGYSQPGTLVIANREPTDNMSTVPFLILPEDIAEV